MVVNHNVLWVCCFIQFSKIKPLNYTPPSLGKQSRKRKAVQIHVEEKMVDVSLENLNLTGEPIGAWRNKDRVGQKTIQEWRARG